MRIVYMGTPDLAADILKALLQASYEIVGVVTQPDRPKGRGKALAFSPVKEVALAADLPILQPMKVRDAEAVAAIRALRPDVIVVAAFGQLLPKELLEIPPLGCINVHTSLLPKYRGASPIQAALLNGDQETGVTIMYMAEGLDTGDIILQKAVEISPEETGGSLHDKLAVLGGETLLAALSQLADKTAKRVPQGETTTPYAKQISKEDGYLDFTKPAVVLERQIRAYHPWPSAYTYLDGKLLKIWRAAVTASSEGSAPGTVCEVAKQGFRIQTGEGSLEVLEVQLEGKRRMTGEEFLRGYPLREGTVCRKE